MKILGIKNQCTACTACISACPVHCISITTNEEGFYFPDIDISKCIECKKCEKVCGVLNPLIAENKKTSYYGFSLNAETRNSSSSGGAFATIAQAVIEKGGNVYGATFNFDKNILIHTDSDTVGLQALQKSKYVESFLGNAFGKIQKDINSGRSVLFCGTPCQVAGLKRIVKDENKLLLTCDFICHGVPSAKLLKEHLEYIHKGQKLTSVDFRPKQFGWSSVGLATNVKQKIRLVPYFIDSFYKGFYENPFLRRSCYDCQYRDNHFSDITLADFWGYRDYDPTINDEKGLSLIVANNDFGKQVVENMGNFELKKIDNKFSDYAYKPRDYSKFLDLRNQFFNIYGEVGFEKAAKKLYMKGKNKQKVIYKLKVVAKKILKR